MADRIATLQRLYDSRAPNYDNENGFHPAQAADYIEWMSLSPGYKVLDLACGTGAITIPAAKLVGPSGKVFGVDISSVSLSVANEKALKGGVDVKFIQHDITSLEEIEELKEGTFDVISCAAAFVLLENPRKAVKGWTKLLKQGGLLIFDVPTRDTMIKGLILDTVAQEVGFPVVYGRTNLCSHDHVRELLEDAGLDSSGCFMTESYKDRPEILDVQGDKAGEMWDDMVKKENWFHSWYEGMNRHNLQAAAREVFIREVRKIVGTDGKIEEFLRFHMAVGRKL